ncbi:MAG: hypothetical protein EOM13_04955, partial [Clostridia bacterium]|nr:hypothetical protein [Clostridia bacterium]
DARTDSYLASLPSLNLNRVRIADKIVDDNERLLTGGFYAEVTLEYDSVIAEEKQRVAPVLPVVQDTLHQPAGTALAAPVRIRHHSSDLSEPQGPAPPGQRHQTEGCVGDHLTIRDQRVRLISVTPPAALVPGLKIKIKYPAGQLVEAAADLRVLTDR